MINCMVYTVNVVNNNATDYFAHMHAHGLVCDFDVYTQTKQFYYGCGLGKEMGVLTLNNDKGSYVNTPCFSVTKTTHSSTEESSQRWYTSLYKGINETSRLQDVAATHTTP